MRVGGNGAAALAELVVRFFLPYSACRSVLLPYSFCLYFVLVLPGSSCPPSWYQIQGLGMTVRVAELDFLKLGVRGVRDECLERRVQNAEVANIVHFARPLILVSALQIDVTGLCVKTDLSLSTDLC